MSQLSLATTASTAACAAALDLSERDKKVLAVERAWWKLAGSKDEAIREQLKMSTNDYYQVLNSLLSTQAALAHDPILVKRLRRQRELRQRERAARRIR